MVQESFKYFYLEGVISQVPQIAFPIFLTTAVCRVFLADIGINALSFAQDQYFIDIRGRGTQRYSKEPYPTIHRVNSSVHRKRLLSHHVLWHTLPET